MDLNSKISTYVASRKEVNEPGTLALEPTSSVRKEQFIDIEGTNGKYKIGSHGSVMSLHNSENPILLKLGRKHRMDNHYRNLRLTIFGKETSFRVHRMVAQHFIPNPFNLPEINHKNGNRADNRVENLEWVSHKDNVKHAKENGLQNPRFGKDNGKSKVTESDVLFIRNSELSISELAIRFTISESQVKAIINKKYWKHVA